MWKNEETNLVDKQKTVESVIAIIGNLLVELNSGNDVNQYKEIYGELYFGITKAMAFSHDFQNTISNSIKCKDTYQIA